MEVAKILHQQAEDLQQMLEWWNRLEDAVQDGLKVDKEKLEKIKESIRDAYGE